MHIDRRRAFESADYDGWMIGVAPVVSRPCACEAPAWWRDELGTRCVSADDGAARVNRSHATNL